MSVINLKTKKSLYYKFFVRYFVIVLLLVVLIISFSYEIIKSTIQTSMAKDLENNCILIADALYDSVIKDDRNFININCKKYSRKIGMRVTVINSVGNVLGESDSDYVGMDNHIDRPEILSAIRNRGGVAVRFSNTLKSRYMYVAYPFFGENGIIGFVRLSIPVDRVNKSLNLFIRQILVLSVVLLAVALFIIHRTTKSFTDPVKELSAVSRRVAMGDFDSQVYTDEDNEIGELIKNFNYMTLRLKELFSEVVSDKEQAESVFRSISEACFVIDKSGIIKNVNDSFVSLFPDAVKGRYYWEIVRNFEILTLMKKTGKDNLSSVKEIIFGDKHLLCSANFIMANKEMILIISDLTEVKKLEKIKRDFVANVSHELRTPLTAIKGFIETILEDNKVDDGETLEYLRIISRHSERLINIVNDLLLLSSLEDGNGKVEFENIDLIKLIESIKPLFTQRISDKNLEFFANVGVGAEFVNGDRFKIEQLFINMIDNSIKYTDTGKISINTSLSDDKKYLNIIFEDTGIGFPSEIGERLFERFFVVDKSRSKKSGGTGLGLSIVKRIVMLHGGKIRVNSQPGKGTIFIVTLPVDNGVTLPVQFQS